MRITEDRVAKLRSLGFTESQARAYLALLDLGAAGVGDVAKATGLPRTRLYPVMNELHGMGLVDALAGEPLRYGPRALDRYLGDRLATLTAERDRLAMDQAGLLREFRLADDPRGPDGGSRLFRGRRSTMANLQEAVEQAERSIILACTAHTLQRFAGAGLDGLLAQRAAEGLTVELVLPPEAHLEEPLASLAPHPLGVRMVSRAPPLEVLLVDGRRTVATALKPDDRSWTRGDDEGIASASPAMHALFLAAVAGAVGPSGTWPSALGGVSVTPGRTTQR